MQFRVYFKDMQHRPITVTGTAGLKYSFSNADRCLHFYESAEPRTTIMAFNFDEILYFHIVLGTEQKL